MSVVQVLYPNGRRVNIKVSPNTPLLSVLVDACQKQGLDPHQHALKHQRKVLDVSQMFRYSGLPNNAKLEVVTSSHDHPRKEQPVRVAVQLQSGDRLQGVFPPTVSIWDLMCSLHGNDQWICGEAVVVYMRREMYGEGTLRKISLEDLGVHSGSVALRLIHRQQQQHASSNQSPMDTTESINISTDNSSDDVIMEHSDSHGTVTSGSTSSHDPITSGSHDTNTVDPIIPGSHDPTTTSSHSTVSCDLVTTGSHDTITTGSHDTTTFATSSYDSTTTSSHDPTTTSSHDPITSGSYDTTTVATSSHDPSLRDSITSGPQDVKGSHDLSTTSLLSKDGHHQSPDEGSCDRQVVVFNMASHSFDTTHITDELPDSFFDVTVDDCVAMQQDLHQKVKKLMNAPLTTASLREAALYQRYSRYNKATVRVQFPDHWVLQGSFKPQESLKVLVKFVREHLTDPTVKFYLYTTPPKRILTNAKLTLVQAGLVPASIVHFGLRDSKGGANFLKTSLLEQAVTLLQADVIAMAAKDNLLPNNESPMEACSSVQSTESTFITPMPPYKDTQHGEKRTVDIKTTKPVPKWFKHSGGKKL